MENLQDTDSSFYSQMSRGPGAARDGDHEPADGGAAEVEIAGWRGPDLRCQI